MKNRFIRDGYTGRTRTVFCPVCFQVLDAVSNMTSKDTPVAGDFTVCIGCASVLRFNDKMDYESSSLMEVPVHLRMEFAKVVSAVKLLGPGRSYGRS